MCLEVLPTVVSCRLLYTDGTSSFFLFFLSPIIVSRFCLQAHVIKRDGIFSCLLHAQAPTVEFRDDHTVLRHGEMSLPPQVS